MSPQEILATIIGLSFMALAHSAGYFLGKRRWSREGYIEGYAKGEAAGWQKRHFEEIERDKAINAKRLATIARKKNA